MTQFVIVSGETERFFFRQQLILSHAQIIFSPFFCSSPAGCEFKTFVRCFFFLVLVTSNACLLFVRTIFHIAIYCVPEFRFIADIFCVTHFSFEYTYFVTGFIHLLFLSIAERQFTANLITVMMTFSALFLVRKSFVYLISSRVILFWSNCI